MDTNIIKNFKCGLHGYIKPIPKCPICLLDEVEGHEHTRLCVYNDTNCTALQMKGAAEPRENTNNK